MLLDELSAFLGFLAHDDVLWMLQHNTKHSAYTCWAGSDNQHGILLLDFGDSGRPEAGSKYIPDEQCLLVCDTVRDFVEPLVRIRDADVFCLATIDATTESPAAVWGLAIVDIAVLAKPAFTAVSLNIDRYPCIRDVFIRLGSLQIHCPHCIEQLHKLRVAAGD